MDDSNRAVELFGKGDWPSFVSFCAASLTDARWLALFIGRPSDGYTVVMFMLRCNPTPAAWFTVKAAADRLGVQILSQPNGNNTIPLHHALLYCTAVAVVSSVIEGTPPTMLHHKDGLGRTPLDMLNDRDSSEANTVEITALFQCALSRAAAAATPSPLVSAPRTVSEYASLISGDARCVLRTDAEGNTILHRARIDGAAEDVVRFLEERTEVVTIVDGHFPGLGDEDLNEKVRMWDMG